MFDRLRKRFCKCKDIGIVRKFAMLAICKCRRCERWWLYNNHEGHRINITKAEAFGLIEEWHTIEKK